MMHGWLIIDKPLGLSSAQVVGRVKWLLKNAVKNRSEAVAEPAMSLRSSVPSEGQEARRGTINKLSPELASVCKPQAQRGSKLKIGHAGTLDPLATGILPLAIGECTKVVQFLTDADKGYEFEVTWGEERSTDDAEGVATQMSDIRCQMSDVQEIMQNFMGEISQIPPQHSAIKVDGQRAYALARGQKAEDGGQIELKARTLTIHDFQLISHSHLASRFSIHCSKGTYIRSIARDMGRALGCYGYVSALRRVAHGKFSLAHAISLENLEEMCKNNVEQAAILPLDEVLDDIPVLKLSALEAQQIRNGIVIKTPLQDTPCVRLYHENTLLAIAEISAGLLKTRRVFNL